MEKPTEAEISLFSRAHLFANLGDFHSAETLYRRVCKEQDAPAESFLYLAMSLIEQPLKKKATEAIGILKHMIEQGYSDLSVISTLIRAYLHPLVYDLKAAEELSVQYRHVQLSQPHDATFFGTLAVLAAELGEVEAAESLYRRAILDTNIPSLITNLKVNLSFCLLQKNQTCIEGWLNYELRWAQATFSEYSLTSRYRLFYPLSVRQLKGKILVVGEQGFGDQLQFMRFANALVLETGCEVTVVISSALVRFVSSTTQNIRVVDRNLFENSPLFEQELSKFNFRVPLLTLPLLMIRAGLFNERKTFYSPTSEYHRAFINTSNPMSRIGRKYIGICLSGSALLPARDIPIEEIFSLFDPAECNWILLDKNRITDYGKLTQYTIERPNLSDWNETAEACRRCDLVISSDTAVGHLSGSLGIRTIIIRRGSVDFRWSEQSNINPLSYKNVTVLSANPRYSWKQIINVISPDIRRLVHQGPHLPS